MRPDMDKLICERERIGSDNRSKKIGSRISLKNDFDSDFGPTFIPNGRRRVYGYKSKELNENLSPLYRFLNASIGRCWDDVYSDIRTNIDTRSAIGLHIMQHLYDRIEQFPIIVAGVPYGPYYNREVDGLYIHPETRLLLHHTSSVAYRHSHNRLRSKMNPDKLHWYDNVWFERRKLMKSVCKCNQPKHDFINNRKPDDQRYCVHGNLLKVSYVWFVVEYAKHNENDVYEVVTYESAFLSIRQKYNLDGPGMKHIIRYRDVPEKLSELFECRRKVANKKELKTIDRMLSSVRSSCVL